MKSVRLKWFAMVISLFYLAFAYSQVVESGSLMYDYFTVFGNWMVITVLSVWFVRKSNIKNPLDFLVLCAFILYLFVLHQYVSYINIGYYFTQEYIGNHHIQLERLNLIPFKTVWDVINLPVFVLAPIIQILGNLFLLTPFAFALISLKITQRIKQTVIITMLISVGIEIHQLIQNFILSGYMYEQGRAADIDDIILNTLGGLIGILFYNLCRRVISIFKSSITN